MTRLICLSLLAALTSACSSMLPQARTESSAFQAFEEASASIESLVPMKSNRATLEKNGFNPFLHPNTKMLTHTDVVRLLVPTALLKRENLDPASWSVWSRAMPATAWK